MPFEFEVVLKCLREINFETFLDPTEEPCFCMLRTVLLLRVCVSWRSFQNTFYADLDIIFCRSVSNNGGKC